VTHTKEEVKQMAQDVDVLDGPNDQGEMFERPGKPYDVIPSPYPNKEAGRAANLTTSPSKTPMRQNGDLKDSSLRHIIMDCEEGRAGVAFLLAAFAPVLPAGAPPHSPTIGSKLLSSSFRSKERAEASLRAAGDPCSLGRSQGRTGTMC